MQLRIDNLRWLALAAAVLLAGGCGDDSPERPRDGGAQDGPTSQPDGGPPPGKTLTWLTENTIDRNSAGTYAVIAGSGAKLGVAYLRKVDDVTVTCPASALGQPTPKSRPTQDVYFAGFDGTAWGSPVKVDQTYGPPFGLDLIYDTAGQPHVGYLGGELSQQECSSSDAVIATSSDGTSWTTTTVEGAGPIGDTVGHWMTLAVDGQGQVHSAYRDVHFGFYEQDGNAKASLRYDGAEAVTDSNGSGTYAVLAFDSSGSPVIAHYNGTKIGSEGGILLEHKQGGSWSTRQLVAGSTAERPDLSTNGAGLFGLAYLDSDKEALFYTEATGDLTSWSETQVDTSLTKNGQFASLAYDGAGNPAISYYRCSDYGDSKCDFGKDALMFAYRIKGTWKTYEVDTGGPQRCGTYTSVTFDSAGDPVIAYKCVEFDNLANDWVDTLKVAQGVWK